jgi:hypothetical protein
LVIGRWYFSTIGYVRVVEAVRVQPPDVSFGRRSNRKVNGDELARLPPAAAKAAGCP